MSACRTNCAVALLRQTQKFAGGQTATDLERDVLDGGGGFGLDDHAVVAARRFERDEGAATGELAAGAVEILPADLGKLP